MLKVTRCRKSCLYLFLHYIIILHYVKWQVTGLDVDTLYISHIQVNQPRSRGAEHVGLMAELIVSLALMHDFCFADAFIGYIMTELCYDSLYVIPLPYWITLVWEGRACQERCDFWLICDCLRICWNFSTILWWAQLPVLLYHASQM